MIMKMNLYCILCLFLTVFSSACGNEKIDGNLIRWSGIVAFKVSINFFIAYVK